MLNHLCFPSFLAHSTSLMTLLIHASFASSTAFYNPLMLPKLLLGGSSVGMQEPAVGSFLGSHQRHQSVDGIQEPIWLPLPSSSQTLFGLLHNAPLQPPQLSSGWSSTQWGCCMKSWHSLLKFLPTNLAAQGVHCQWNTDIFFIVLLRLPLQHKAGVNGGPDKNIYNRSKTT